MFAKMLEHFLNKYRAEVSDNSIAYLKNITILTSEHHNMQYRKNYTFIHECLLRYLHRQILPILGDTLTSNVRVLSTC